jgi:uncharacterized membrane protein YbhN (UPF0104 family)
MRGRIASTVVAALVTAAALWLLLKPGTLPHLSAALAQADWPALAVAATLSAPLQWLRAWRFAVLTNGTLDPPPPRLVRAAFQLNFLNFVLPFRLGELSYPVLARRALGQPMLQAAGVLVAARLFDLSIVGALLLGSAAMLGLAGPPAGNLALAILALGFASIPALLIVAARSGLPLLAKIPLLKRLAGLLGDGAARLSSSRIFAATTTLSLAVWGTFFVVALLATAAVAEGIPPAAIMLGAAAGTLAFALPVSGIAGLGASQAAWAAALLQTGVPWHDAVVSAFALYAATLAGALIFGSIAMVPLGRGRPRRSPALAFRPTSPEETSHAHRRRA